MKLIAHKGNVNGPDPSKENTPEQIEWCIDNGYDVEIDVRYNSENDKFYLGHDDSQYEINWWWLAGKTDHLWIHCKDITTLHEFAANTSGYNYFWHQGDDYTLTSKGHIWAYPGKAYTKNTVVVVPENDVLEDVTGECYGICSAYVGRMR